METYEDCLCFTIDQPECWAVVLGIQNFAATSQDVFYRGRVFLHAGKINVPFSYELDDGTLLPPVGQWPAFQVIAVADLCDCYLHGKPGVSHKFELVFRDIGFLRHPVRCRGFGDGLWFPNRSAAAKIMEAAYGPPKKNFGRSQGKNGQGRDWSPACRRDH